MGNRVGPSGCGSVQGEVRGAQGPLGLDLHSMKWTQSEVLNGSVMSCSVQCKGHFVVV